MRGWGYRPADAVSQKRLTPDEQCDWEATPRTGVCAVLTSDVRVYMSGMMIAYVEKIDQDKDETRKKICNELERIVYCIDTTCLSKRRQLHHHKRMMIEKMDQDNVISQRALTEVTQRSLKQTWAIVVIESDITCIQSEK
jgi:hypothetical protein